MKQKVEYLSLINKPFNFNNRLNEGGWNLIFHEMNKFGNTVYYLKRFLIN